MSNTIQLYPGVTLRCFPVDRFKQGCLSIQLVRPMRRQEAAMNALLPSVLLRGTETARDMRDITLRLDDLYGASVGTLVRRIGDYQTTGLHCSFIEDQYALGADQVLAPMLGFLQELLRRPLLENGVFCRRFVESEKKNLIATIESNLNDKQSYTASQMLKRMCREDSFGIPRLGEKAQVQAITAEALHEHYQKILHESRVDLFYVGSAQPETVAQLLRPMFDFPRDYVPLAPQTPYRPSQPGTYTETMEVAQGKLAMGFVTPTTLRDRDFAAMQVFNTVFGGGFTSKLFMHIREKQSLCYDISSGYHGSKGIILVSAGIDSHMEQPVRQEVLTQLAACQAGDIPESQLQAAKEALLNSLRGIHDSPGGIESFYATGAISGLELTREAYMEAVQQVTLEQVAEAARSVKLHTVYFLKGVQ